MRAALILAFTLAALSGCASVFGEANPPPRLEGSGREIFAPRQWQILCYEKPWLEICKPDKAP